jgi:N-acetylmuramoyl-L-alanine amidase
MKKVLGCARIFLVCLLIVVNSRSLFAASIKSIEALPLLSSPETSQALATNDLCPVQIVFDIEGDFKVKEEANAAKNALSLTFSLLRSKDNKDLEKKVRESLSKVCWIKEYSVTKQADDAYTIALTFSNKHFEKGDVIVRACRVEAPYNARRFVLYLHPKKLLQQLVTNQRCLQLAHVSFEHERASKKKTVADARKVKPFRVVLDAGHGGNDCGAKGLFATVEKEITLDIVHRLKPMLESDGCEVFLTRSADITIDLFSRFEYARQQNGSIFVSIHANSSLKKGAHGIETYHVDPAIYTKGTLFFNDALLPHYDTYIHSMSTLSQSLSKSILEDISRSLAAAGCNPFIRGVKKEGYATLLSSLLPATCKPLCFIPATLVEVGFISNPEEAAHLAKESYRNLLAHGIYKGIKNYKERQRGNL